MPIAQEIGRIAAQGSIGILDALVPLLVEQVEAGCESVCGILVEMILGCRIDLVVDQGQSLVNVIADMLVELSHRATLVVGLHLSLGGQGVGQAHVLVGCCGVVAQTEHIGQLEVGPGTAKQSLATICTQAGRIAHVFNSRQGLVGVCCSHVAGIPYGLGSIVVGTGLVFPEISLFLLQLVKVVRSPVVTGVV